MVVAFEWTTLLPTDLMLPLLANTWVIAVHRIVTPILAETPTGTLIAILIVTVNRIRAVEVTSEKEIGILMAATAETGANVAARLLHVVDGTPPNTEGGEVIQEVPLEVAAPLEVLLGITTLRRRLPLLQPRTVSLILLVGKVYSWPSFPSSMCIQTLSASDKSQTDQGQRQGQGSKFIK